MNERVSGCRSGGALAVLAFGSRTRFVERRGGEGRGGALRIGLAVACAGCLGASALTAKAEWKPDPWVKAHEALGEIELVEGDQLFLFGAQLSLTGDGDKALEMKGGGFRFRLPWVDAGLVMVCGEAERDGVNYGGGWSSFGDPTGGYGYIVAMDLRLSLPRFASLTGENSDGLNLGLGPGFYFSTLTDNRNGRDVGGVDNLEDIEDLGLSLSVFAAYKVWIGEVEFELKRFMGDELSDFGTMVQISYGFTFTI